MVTFLRLVCGNFVFTGLALRLASGLVAVVSRRLFSFAFGVGSSCVRRFRVCVSYSNAPYIDRSFKLTLFIAVREVKKNEFGVVFLTRLKSATRILGGESGRPSALVTIDLRGRN